MKCLPQLALFIFGGVLMNAAMAANWPEYDSARVKVLPSARLEALPFSLHEVRLLPGPFQHAQQKDAEYLLELEPDRLLHRFHEYAGLKPKGELYGGWETGGVSGHTLGHYLSACSMMYASTGDERFKERVDYIVGELALCQAQYGTGYVGGIPEGQRVFAEIAEGKITSQGFDLNGLWVPWYTLHKLLAGLVDAWLYCDNDEAKRIAADFGDWALETTARLTDEQWQQMLACEHGGMNEALANLYAITGEERYLTLSKKFFHQAILDPLAAGEDRLGGIHANTQIPKVIGTARLYELTGEARYLTISRFFWDRVAHHHSYATGGHSEGEAFSPSDTLAEYLSPSTMETCNTYNMLKLTRHLIELAPTSELGDFYERALLNHILASQNPGDGMMCYYVSLKPGGFKVYSTPHDSFWCCTGTGIENHARYGEGIYFHSEDALWVNLYVPSELAWAEKGLTITQQTRFPEEPVTKLSFDCQRPVKLEVLLRKPYWLVGPMTLKLNGKPVAGSETETGFVSIEREWRAGDVLEVALPMGLHLAPMPDNPGRVAVMYGPLVLAGELGKVGSETGPVPVFLPENRPLERWIQPVPDQPLTFISHKAGLPEDIVFKPFYAVHGAYYSVYFDLMTREGWKQLETERRAEAARLAALQARTVDFCQPGDGASEGAHKVQSEGSGTGNYRDHPWRHAPNGWFSYELAVLPDIPLDLVITYWGSDVGSRTFDVLVDGVTVATHSLNNNLPGKFYDEVVSLPAELTAGKQRITVRFQAHPGNTAGGAFGVRIVKREP